MSELKQNLEEALFEAALAQTSVEDRAAFLEDACHNDPALRSRLEVLLEGHFQAEGFLNSKPDEVEEQLKPPKTDRDVHSTFIGQYKLLERIGEGGFGEVWMAEQSEPVKRRVALKVIKLGMDTRQVVARFEAERQALALMEHPNIAKVLDAGATCTGRPFFVMELVRGVRITEYCDQNHLPTSERLKLFIQVCRAVQHAHQKGVIHRDIKPSNILVTLHDGVAVPKVIDFGIAKATREELSEKTVFTQFRQFLGTPAYVSPEQAEMGALDVDTRSDIYSLGVLLYELLTGKTPFGSSELLAAGLDELRRTIREKAPLRPSTRLQGMSREELTTTAQRRGAEVPKLIGLVRGDLDWVVMKCLQKDRAQRYETANSLAQDIERHLKNEPILARPPSRWYELQKTFRRHKLGFAAAAMVTAILVIGVWVSTEEAMRARRAELAERERAYAASMNVAHEALAEKDLGRALDLLNAQRPAKGQKDLRGWEWRYLWQQTRSDALFTLCQEHSQIQSLAASPDGNWLAVGGVGGGGLSLWHLPTRQQLSRLAERERWIRAAFSPTSALLAFSGYDPSAPAGHQYMLHLWDATHRRMVAEFALNSRCLGLAFSGDDRTLVTLTAGNIILWQMPEGTMLACYAAEPSGWDLGNGFAASSDLKLAAYGSIRNEICLVNLSNGRVVWKKAESNDEITNLAFSPDGTLLASTRGLEDSKIGLWEVGSGKELPPLEGHHGSVFGVVFWPDGTKLASASTDGTIRIWDVPRRRCLDELRGHLGPVWRLALLSDAKTLVSGSKDGTVCFGDTSLTHWRKERITVPENILAWRFLSDSRSLLTLGSRGQICRWNGPGFQTRELLGQLENGVLADPYFHCVSGDGRFLAIGSTNGLVEVWDVARQMSWRQLNIGTGKVRPQTFLAGSDRLIVQAVREGVLQEWDLTSGMKTQSWPAPSLMDHGLAVSPDQQTCLAAGDEGYALLRDLPGKRSLKLNLDSGSTGEPTFSPDGKLLAVASGTGFARVWRTDTWQEVATLRGFPRYVESVAFSEDGARLATGSFGAQAVKLWSTESWQDVFALPGDGALFLSTAFSPDGSAIGSLNVDGVLHIWQAPSWETIEKAERSEQRATQSAPHRAATL